MLCFSLFYHLSLMKYVSVTGVLAQLAPILGLCQSLSDWDTRDIVALLSLLGDFSVF